MEPFAHDRGSCVGFRISRTLFMDKALEIEKPGVVETGQHKKNRRKDVHSWSEEHDQAEQSAPTGEINVRNGPAASMLDPYRVAYFFYFLDLSREPHLCPPHLIGKILRMEFKKVMLVPPLNDPQHQTGREQDQAVGQ